MSYNYVTTFNGGKFYFDNPKESDVCIEDIAHNLSNICRYNGSTKYRYSVGQHSIAVASHVIEVGGSCTEALQGLLHDASEAYICDIPRPIKPYLTNYFELESKISSVIYRKFGISEISSIVKRIDENIVADEGLHVLAHVPDWVGDYKPIGCNPHLFAKYSPEHIECLFLGMFEMLTEGQ